MILYNSIGPNPRVVRMFAAEKGIELELRPVDVIAGENRLPSFRDISPTGTTPVLELDDGTRIGETIAICEYLDELAPEPRLIGATPVERAQTRMWTRRIDLEIATPMTLGFRAAEGRAMFEPRVKIVRQEAAGDLKAIATDRLLWLEERLGDQPWIAGDRFSMADVALFPFVEFGALVGQPLPAAATRLGAWHARVAARPSAAA